MKQDQCDYIRDILDESWEGLNIIDWAGTGEALSKITVEIPNNQDNGDVSTNAAMVLKKFYKCSMEEFADALTSIVKSKDEAGYISEISFVKPGFINFKLTNKFWHNRLSYILNSHKDYGFTGIDVDKKINLEFCSPNPTGPLHIGHVRGAVFGDTLASLMERCGGKITRECYINDDGKQIETLIKSIKLRQRELKGEKVELEQGMYPGDYIIDVASTLLKKGEMDDYTLGRGAIDEIMKIIKNEFAKINVNYDVFTHESEVVKEGFVKKAISALEKKNLIYKAIPEKPKDEALAAEWSPEEQTLFRSTEFGDDQDRTIMRSDGSDTYFSRDAAYHLNKVERGFDELLITLGLDHGTYYKRIQAVVKALSGGSVELKAKMFALVKLTKNGQQVKLSKRNGELLRIDEMLSYISLDALRFSMLIRKNDSEIILDLDKLQEASQDNPVFYVQYAHTRICSAMEKALAAFPEIDKKLNDTPNLSKYLKEDEEISLIRLLSSYPVTIKHCIKTFEPHHLVFYLLELAKLFHNLWNAGKMNTNLRLVAENEEQTLAKLALLRAVQIVIQNSLEVLKVSAPTSM